MKKRDDKNIVQVLIHTETGCNPLVGEYSLHIGSVIGALDISSVGGVDDVSLIKDCIIERVLDEIDLPEEGTTEIILRESGEWEDVFWHKYYEIESAEVFFAGGPETPLVIESISKGGTEG